MSPRRVLIFLATLLALCTLPFLGIQAYYGNNGLPDSLFFHRTARHYCIKCGSQATSRMASLFDGFNLSETQPHVAQTPRLGGVNPATCEHNFMVIAASDRYIDFRTLRLKRWSYGIIEGESLWSEPALVTAFANLSRSNLQDSNQLFSYLVALHYRGRLTGKLLDTVTGTNADAVFPVLYQTFTNSGNALLSQRNRKQ